MRFGRIMLVCFIVMLSSASLVQAKTDWRFPVGLTYVTGFSDVLDQYKSNLEAEGYSVDTTLNVPVGITFNPYVEFDFGLRIGGGLGPFSMIAVTKVGSSPYGSSSKDNNYYCLPINFNVGYSFLPKASISPYVKAGISYPIASGDFIEGKNAGFLGAVGVEFMRKRAVGLGLEIAIDTSTVSVVKEELLYYYGRPYINSTTEDIKPIGTSISFFVVF